MTIHYAFSLLVIRQGGRPASQLDRSPNGAWPYGRSIRTAECVESMVNRPFCQKGSVSIFSDTSGFAHSCSICMFPCNPRIGIVVAEYSGLALPSACGDTGGRASEGGTKCRLPCPLWLSEPSSPRSRERNRP